MSLFDNRLFTWLQPRPAPTLPAPAPRERARPLSARALAGGRLTRDDNDTGGGFFTIASPPDAESQWRVLDLDTDTLGMMSPARLVELLADLSPEISAGIWYFLRLANPGWQADALRPGSDVQDPSAQAALDSFLKSCTGVYDGTTAVPFDTIINSLFLSAFLRGGLLAELVLDKSGRLPINLAVPDPYVIRFKLVKDPVRGDVWQLGQYHGSTWTALTRETIQYVPIDPLPGNPYGRAMVSPALFTCLFLIGLLHDLRRVVSQQGYPRLDIVIDFEKLSEIAPPEAAVGTAEFQTWVNEIVTEVQSFYAQLEPDDAYVHSSIIGVNRPVGAIDAQSLGMVGELITKLEMMAARATKAMPLVFGIHEVSSEGNSNRQWEIHVASIKAVQHLCETLLEKELGLALQCQGIQANVRFKFAELRAAEMLRDAQTEMMQINNAKAKYDNGWIGQDEAALEVTGHPAESPAPRIAESSGPEMQGDDGDGQERIALLAEIRAARTAVERQLGMVPSANGHHH